MSTTTGRLGTPASRLGNIVLGDAQTVSDSGRVIGSVTQTGRITGTVATTGRISGTVTQP